MKPLTSSTPIAMRSAVPRQRRAHPHRLGQLQHHHGPGPADEGHQAPGDAIRDADAAPPGPVHRADRGDPLHRDVGAAGSPIAHGHAPSSTVGGRVPRRERHEEGHRPAAASDREGRHRARKATPPGAAYHRSEGTTTEGSAVRKWYGRDRGLTTRMSLTLFGLGLIYVLFIGALIAAGVGAVMVLVIAAGLRRRAAPVRRQDRPRLDAREGHRRPRSRPSCTR